MPAPTPLLARAVEASRANEAAIWNAAIEAAIKALHEVDTQFDFSVATVPLNDGKATYANYWVDGQVVIKRSTRALGALRRPEARDAQG